MQRAAGIARANRSLNDPLTRSITYSIKRWFAACPR
jgi:hypothetical protein